MPVTPEGVQPIADQAALAIEQRLVQVVQGFEEPLRGRVTMLLWLASEAIVKLADLDLVRYEADEEQGGHTLALWEELAPVMGTTVQHVNDVIDGVAAQFPAPAERDGKDDLEAAFGPGWGSVPVDGGVEASLEDQIAALAAAVSSGMRRDVTRLGDRLRNPTVMSDPWMLIQDLLEFRGRVRAAIGELIYQVCTFVAEVDREEVVPGYAAEMANSLLVRQATSNLAFLFRGHAKRIAAAPQERILAVLQDALKDVHAFSRTRALHYLRTSDKRIFLESRASLHRLAKATPTPALEIRQGVENLARFLDSMSVVSRRENLRLYDRAQLARAGRHIEHAEVNRTSAETARAELMEALKAASALYGRDPQLDAYLRAQRHFPADWLLDGELALEIARLRGVLAGVAPP